MSQPNPYERFRDRELSATDLLALDRTVLANERTLLAYLRTALALLVVGGTGFKFFNELWIQVAGGVFILLAAITFIIGVLHHRRTAARLAVLKAEQE